MRFRGTICVQTFAEVTVEAPTKKEAEAKLERGEWDDFEYQKNCAQFYAHETLKKDDKP